MPHWNRTSKWKKAHVSLIRQRDGDLCWLCNRDINFGAARPNTKRAPTIEHLVPRSLGGGDQLDNLVLCHPGCNRHLKNRSLADKEKMRVKHHRETLRFMAKLKPPQ